MIFEGGRLARLISDCLDDSAARLYLSDFDLPGAGWLWLRRHHFGHRWFDLGDGQDKAFLPNKITVFISHAVPTS
jgi:hypothetical protein